MANISFFGRLASKNNKSSYEVSKETGIAEDKIKEVFKGERKLPTKHVDAVVKSIQSKDNLSDLDYLNAKKFFEEENFLSLRNRFGYDTQRGLALALSIPPCYVSFVEGGNLARVPKSVLIKMYDFFQDELNINTVSATDSKKRRKKKKTSTKSLSTVIDLSATSKVYDKDTFDYALPEDFNFELLYQHLRKCKAYNVIELYRLLDQWINSKNM